VDRLGFKRASVFGDLASGAARLCSRARVWAVLHHRLGWTVQRPRRRAAERDQAAIDRWVKERWPAIKQTVSVWACGPSGSLSEFDAGAAA
jgi:Winged helix-turn helix